MITMYDQNNREHKFSHAIDAREAEKFGYSRTKHIRKYRTKKDGELEQDQENLNPYIETTDQQ